LTIESGGTFTSGSGNVQINGALTLDGELVQGGGNLNLIGEGAIGAPVSWTLERVTLM
jgi:hypothetical protein